MKNLFITISILISTLSMAQNDYQTEMNKALKAFQSKDVDTVNQFEQLNKNYPNDRLAQYYLALSKTIDSFETENLSAKENLVKEAQNLILGLEKSYPNDAEILNLKALNLSAEILLNPMVNGMFLMPEIKSIYSKSLLLNPNNPRSILSNAEFNINTAKFIGGDISKDCKAVKKALDLFNAEKVNGFEPNWGKNRAENLIQNECKSF